MEPMHVAMVGPYPDAGEPPRGGVQAATLALCNALKQRTDVRLTVIAVDGRETVSRRIAVDGVHMIRVPHHGGLPGWWRCFHRDIPRILTQLCPDVVHVQGVPSLALRTRRCVLTIHGNLSRDIWHNKQGFRRLFRAFGAMLTEGVPGALVRRRIVLRPGVRGTYIPNPLNPVFVNSDRTPRNVNQFVACGEISPLKNTLGLLRAFQRLHGMRPESKLVIIGTGEPSYVEQCQCFVEVNGLESAVEFVGPLDIQAVASTMRSSQCLVHFSNRENAPMVVLEGLASGCVIVATDVGATRFLLRGDPWSTLVPPRNEASLLNEMSTAPNKRVDADLRKLRVEEFSPEAVADKTVAVYRQIRNP